MIELVTRLGSLAVVRVVLGATTIWAVTRRRFLDAAVLPLGLALTYAAVHIAKNAYDRPRPADPLVDADGSAYPVGARRLLRRLGRRGDRAGPRREQAWRRASRPSTSAVVLAAVIGLTRVYLRVHHLSDVEGGWGLAVAIFALLGLVALVVGSCVRMVRAMSHEQRDLDVHRHRVGGRHAP